MRPAARLQAAIEVLEALDGEAAPLDRLLRGYFRRRRYAGSGDRAAIGATVHDVLRHRGELLWRCGDAATPRLQLLGVLRWREGESLDEIDALCSGRDHAPAPLSPAERRALSAPAGDLATAPDWVHGNYPAWLDTALTRAFAARKGDEVAALNRRAPLDLRVNGMLATRQTVAAMLLREGIEATPTPLAPFGLRLPGRPDLRRHPLYRDGLVEVQDEGSQVVAWLSQPPPGGTVVDFCAGAGGKSLALAAAMAGTGTVLALDAAAARLRRLTPRLDRAGVDNVRSHALDGDDDPWLADKAATADCVLVDAPCSGLGAWRRQPEARWRLDPAGLAAVCRQQQAILRQAAGLVRPGGRLIYATCSLLCEENEDQVGAFLAARTDFTLLPVARIWAEWLPDAPPGDGPYLRLSPARHGCDGFFVAILQRQTMPLDSTPAAP